MSDKWIGKYVIVRCRDAGVHAGILVSHDGRACELKKARRLWRWRVNGNKGTTLSDVAVVGLDKKDTRISAPVSIMLAPTNMCRSSGCLTNWRNNNGTPSDSPRGYCRLEWFGEVLAADADQRRDQKLRVEETREKRHQTRWFLQSSHASISRTAATPAANTTIVPTRTENI